MFDKSKLNKVQGFEKMIAACFIMGNHYYKDQNLLVQTLSNNSYQMIKVDHGISFENFHLNYFDFLTIHFYLFKRFKYTDSI